MVATLADGVDCALACAQGSSVVAPAASKARRWNLGCWFMLSSPSCALSPIPPGVTTRTQSGVIHGVVFQADQRECDVIDFQNMGRTSRTVFVPNRSWELRG